MNIFDTTRAVGVRRLFDSSAVRCALLALLGFVIHLPALHGPRIWDDETLIGRNPLIRSPLLIVENFRHYLFAEGFSRHYRPVQNISFIVDYFFWNTDTLGYHLTNVLLHIASGLLLYFLLRRILPTLIASERGATSSPAAFLIALIWMVHPVHSAAVDYISGRADSLAFAFSAGAWLLYLLARCCERKLRRIALFLFAAVTALLALCSREIACAWVAIFVAYLLFMKTAVTRRQRLATVACCVLLFASYFALRQLPQARPGSAPSSGWPIATRMVLMSRALADYARLMVFPANLHMERSIYGGSHPANALELSCLTIGGVCVLALMVAGCSWRADGRRARLFGAAWFAVSYLPVSNLVQLNATVAEHWLYLPSVGLLIFAADCVVALNHRGQRFAVAFASLAVLAFSARAFVRSGDWSNDEQFYRRTLAAGGCSVRLSVNIAQVFARRGQLAEAEKAYREVLATSADFPVARHGLADILLRENRGEEAERILRESVNDSTRTRNEYPRTWSAAVALADLQHAEHEDAAALATLARTETAYPDIWEIRAAKAELIEDTTGPADALPIVQQFAESHRWHYGAAFALGRLYGELQQLPAADTQLRHASRLDVHDADALDLLATIYLHHGKLDDAAQLQRQAIARRPAEPARYLRLAKTLAAAGHREEARTALAEVQRLRLLASASD